MGNDDYAHWRPRYPKLPVSTLVTIYAVTYAVCATICYIAYITH